MQQKRMTKIYFKHPYQSFKTIFMKDTGKFKPFETFDLKRFHKL